MGDISIEYNVSSALTKEYNKNPAKFKQKYKHVNYAVETLDVSDVFLADTIPWPNKNYVNRIAKHWSFNPKRMTEQGFSSEGLGLHGRIR